jgi:hypothetical protein
MDMTVTFPGESETKPKTAGSPASWKQIRIRRNTGRAFLGLSRRAEPVLTKAGILAAQFILRLAYVSSFFERNIR